MAKAASYLLGFALIAVGTPVSDVNAQEKVDVYRVPTQYVDCIIGHRAKYLETPRSLISIYPTLCPTITPSPADVARLATNSGIDINSNSKTIIVPSRKAKCFFRKLSAARRAAPKDVKLLSVDISRCG
ncbi:MAG: hypothetical protein Q7T68_05360 [Sphingopyxis sp.]|nr:hypothetical protein [Sphingopyxis sp.]